MPSSSSHRPLMYMFRCTACRRIISKTMTRAEICPCGGTFAIDRDFHPVDLTDPAPHLHDCETCLNMRVFVVASRAGTRTVRCPDCLGENDEMVASGVSA